MADSLARTLARTLAPNCVQKGRNQSITGNLEEVDAHPRKRKNPKENKVILGVFVVGDIGLGDAQNFQGIKDISPELAQKLAQSTARTDIQSIFRTLGDKERIEAVLFLKKLRERSSVRL